MKKKVIALSASVTMLFSTVTYSQDAITEFLDFGQHNASLLIESYLEPLGHSIGSNINSGWYNTGQAHNLGRFDFRFAIPVTFVGQDYMSFVFDPDDFEELSLIDADDYDVPTLFGSKGAGPGVEFDGETFSLPPGTDMGYFPVIPPVLQLNVGLIRDTEIMIRFIPTISAGDFSTGLYGFGIKHGVAQYIPVIEKLPFDISLIGSYANMSSAYGLEYDPTDNPNIDIDNQELDISSSAYSVNLVASKRLPILTVYGGVRYMYASTQFVMVGNYEIGDEVLTDPVSFEIESSQVGLNAGTRIKLGFISFFVDGTWSKYSTITGGVSLGFHN